MKISRKKKKKKKLFVARGMNPTSSALSITVDCENCKISDRRLKLVLIEGLIKPETSFRFYMPLLYCSFDRVLIADIAKCTELNRKL